MANGLILLHPSQTTLIAQLRHFPKADHDDGPDALEMLWSLARKYSAPIEWVSLGDEDLGHDDFEVEDDLYSIWRG